MDATSCLKHKLYSETERTGCSLFIGCNRVLCCGLLEHPLSHTADGDSVLVEELVSLCSRLHMVSLFGAAGTVARQLRCLQVRNRERREDEG